MFNIYFHKYLKVAPFALALWRAFEAQHIEDGYRSVSNVSQLKFKRPMLDLGCGFGEFAGVFFDRQVEVGIDINFDDLVRAKKINKYKELFMADARKMPFPDEKFATVISVSVLEHIPHPEKAIAEVFRVLKPGGIFIYTVPTIEINKDLFYPEIFRTLGLNGLRSFYLNTFHKVFKHVNLFSVKKWQIITREAGFKIIYLHGTFTRNMMLVFDLALIAALPSQICRWLLNTRWVWGLSWKKKILDLIFNRLGRDKRITGSNILVIAKKK
ncbi:class I SAM-dependent methyltransferase [Candidatus Gottesmanbacteria bacterium]|nr:class I SAM-dependent methyltransferase [Candidatus Gottesmanbacteria bacterium]